MRVAGVRIAVAVAVSVAALGPALGRRARADEMLRGPHPLRSENDVSIHAGFGKGYAGWLGGPKVFFGYGYHVRGPGWLDLQINFQQNTCEKTLTVLTPCQDLRSNATEMIAGMKWKWRMDIPMVFYAKAGGGPVYVFPDAFRSAIGLAGRGVAGAKYFLFEWLGIGAEIAMSVGHVFHHELYPGDHGYGSLDFGIGVELDF